MKAARRKTRRGALAVICVALALLAFSPNIHGSEPISATIARPFPAIMPLDYAGCRAAAWLTALARAAELEPGPARAFFGEMDLDQRLAALALAAFAFPIAHVTPETASAITVELANGDPRRSLSKFVTDPQPLILAMAFISDTINKLASIRKAWPKNLDDARASLANLEKLVAGLDALWLVSTELVENKLMAEAPSRLAELARAVGDSAALYFLLARARLEANSPRGAIEAANEALAIHTTSRIPNTEHGGNGLWIYLEAAIYRLRALAHWRLDQTALARADLESALRYSGTWAGSVDERLEMLAEHADLSRIDRDFEAMCEDYRQMCALGQCSEIATARISGECAEIPPPSASSASGD